MSRDWLSTLWLASYKGASFWVESDSEDGGRRIVVHEFPMRDDPFLEDLGEAKRDFNVTAYLASDTADNEASSLVAVCALRGPGVLVLPAQGPLMVRCLTFKRDREKDRAGKIAFSLHFVREGAAASLVSIASLANLVFAAADGVMGAVGEFLQTATTVLGRADYIVGAVVSGLQEGAAILEAVRTSEPVDPGVSAAQRGVIQAIYDDAPTLVSSATGVDPDIAPRLVASYRAIADGMPATSAHRVFGEVLDNAPVVLDAPGISVNAAVAQSNAGAVGTVLRLAATAAYAEAIIRMDIPDRGNGITIRAQAAERFDQELGAIPARDVALFRSVLALRGAVVEYLSRAILDRAPVVTVESNMTMPSLFWSYRLYAAADRGAEIVARNRVAHPSYLPTSFEALSN